MREPVVEAVIFDVGNVLQSVDLERTKAALTGVRGLRATGPELFLDARDLIELLGRGRVTVTEFIAQLSLPGVEPVDEAAFLEAWNACMGDLLPDAVELVKDIKKQSITVAALTNTNEPHANWIGSRYATFYRRFKVVHQSHRTGYRKPDPEAYRAVLAACGVSAGAAVFFDDLEENVGAAARLGIKAFRVNSPGEARRCLRELGVL